MIDETLDGVERAVDPVRGTRIFTKVALTFLAGALLIGFVGLILRVTGATFDNAGAQGEVVVADEDWLSRKGAEIRALERDVRAAREAFDRKKAEADSRLISRQDDRVELDRLNGMILSLDSRRAEAIKEWEVMAASGGTAAVWTGN